MLWDVCITTVVKEDSCLEIAYSETVAVVVARQCHCTLRSVGLFLLVQENIELII